MGNCTSRQKKKRKGDSDDQNTDNKANEDVTYASINHNTAKGSRRTRVISEDDCDYATVNIPEVVPPEAVSECSSKEECADDYVLMG